MFNHLHLAGRRCGRLGTVRAGVLAILAFCALSRVAPAQFDSGSDGSDGALIYSPGTTGTIDFDPTSFVPPLDPDRDGVYHFTAVSIPASVTLRFDARFSGWGSIYWLSQDDIVINGTLDLRGATGHDGPSPRAGEISIPGPGGYPGAWESNPAIEVVARQFGFGPGVNNFGGKHPGTYFLHPLTGGSGGGGYTPYSRRILAQSGAGGGAILLASNTLVSVDGAIKCNGGDGGIFIGGGTNGNGGGAGAIRIVAPVFAGQGALLCQGGIGHPGPMIQDNGSPGETGWVRVEASDDNFGGLIDCGRVRRVTLTPGSTYIIPASGNLPTIKIARIGGVTMPAVLGGTFDIPDAALDTQAPVLFEIEASYVPLGTALTILLWNETEHVISFPTSGVAGTLEASTATVSRVVPNGYTWGFVYTSWTY